MSKLLRKPIQITTLLGLSFALASAAEADSIMCNVHAPKGQYRIELFRVGDRLPTFTNRNVDIDGGKWIFYFGVPTGNWFVRATLESNDYFLSGQGASGHITSWFPWWQTLPDCWVRP